MQKAEELGDDLCKWCPLDKKGVYHVPGGFMAGCEGSRCKEAYEHYAEECAANTEEKTGTSANSKSDPLPVGFEFLNDQG